MSGPVESKTAKERLEEIDTILNEYEAKIGLPEFKPPGDEQELQDYLNYNRDHIEKLSAQECALIAYRLAQFAFHIQRAFNKEQSRMIWAKAHLDRTISGKLEEYSKYMKYEMKVASVVKEDSSAQALDAIMIYAKQRAERLTFLATSIKHLSDVMLANQRAKTKFGTN